MKLYVENESKWSLRTERTYVLFCPGNFWLVFYSVILHLFCLIFSISTQEFITRALPRLQPASPYPCTLPSNFYRDSGQTARHLATIFCWLLPQLPDAEPRIRQHFEDAIASLLHSPILNPV